MYIYIYIEREIVGTKGSGPENNGPELGPTNKNKHAIIVEESQEILVGELTYICVEE